MRKLKHRWMLLAQILVALAWPDQTSKWDSWSCMLSVSSSLSYRWLERSLHGQYYFYFPTHVNPFGLSQRGVFIEEFFNVLYETVLYFSYENGLQWRPCCATTYRGHRVWGHILVPLKIKFSFLIYGYVLTFFMSFWKDNFINLYLHQFLW